MIHSKMEPWLYFNLKTNCAAFVVWFMVLCERFGKPFSIPAIQSFWLTSFFLPAVFE